MATSSTKTVPIIIAFVAGVTVSYFASSLLPMIDGMSGTGAPAEQNGSTQPTDDFRLRDQTLAELMQSDEFTAMTSNPDIASLLADARFKGMFSDARTQELVRDGRFQVLMGDTRFHCKVWIPAGYRRIPVSMNWNLRFGPYASLSSTSHCRKSRSHR